MKKLLLTFAVVFITNAQAQPIEDNLIPLESITLTSSNYASAIQWNEEYIVTAKHVPFVRGEYKCISCDVQFVKRKHLAGSLPVWRERKAYEKLTAIGNVSGRTYIVSGNDINIERRDQLNTGSGVIASTVQAVPGMSGGPMIGSDGAVVGMTVSSLFPAGQNDVMKKFAKGGNITFYVPYAEIQRQWLMFQNQIRLSENNLAKKG